MLTVTTEAHKEELRTSTKTSPSLQNITPALEAKKTPSMSRSNNLRSTYLQQFKQYPLPLIPLPWKTLSQLCQSPQPLPPRCNPVLLLEVQVHQEEEEDLWVEEEVHPVEEEVRQAEEEEETLHKLPSVTESPWAHYPPYLKEITQKLRAFSESFPPISSLTTMSQLSPHSLKESPSLWPASKDQRSTDGPSSSSNGWWPYNLWMTTTPPTSNS